jgi:putative pyoverdin transport system ATP-binding/permease protein
MKKLKIIDFISREAEGPKMGILVMSCIGGISYTLFVFVINQASQITANVDLEMETRLFLMFFVICALIVVAQRYTLTMTTLTTESTVRKVRLRLLDKLRRTELQFLEKIDKGDIYARIAQDTDYISYSATNAIHAFVSVTSSIGLFIYAAFISMTGFLLILFLVAVLAVVFFYNYRSIKEKLNTARLKEAEFFDTLNDTLSGFKEIKINTHKNDALFEDIVALSDETEQLKVAAELKSNRNIVLSFLLYEGLLAVVVFLLPILSGAHAETVIQLVSVMLFVYGMLYGIVNGWPVVLNMNAAVENIERLETTLDSFETFVHDTEPDRPSELKEIELHSVSFQYTDEDGDPMFLMGPVDLTIRQGEVLFIVGGNGCGKSTLLKLLTGLYFPLAGGQITLDNQTVTYDTYQTYRELFSIIFTDFHLFHKLYGIDSVNEDHVKQLLKEMDLQNKTDYADDRFTNIDLSTGQRKRLAYISALLEDKPILVFDEWAADQDPTYRKLFYERFLDDLRAMKKTVIAVTHDDNYFDMADRVIRMEEGRVMDMIK